MSENIEKKIKLFSNQDDVILQPGESIGSIDVEITADGGYNGNGEFESCDDGPYKIIGFNRSNGREFWIGRGWIKISTNLSGDY